MSGDFDKKAYSKKVYAFRKEIGLCTRCGKENDNLPLLTCKNCSEKRKHQRQQVKDYYEKHGLCNICGKEKMENSKFCYRCWETMYDGKQKRQEKMTAEEKELERLKANSRNRERKKKALKNGICYYCLKRKALEGRRECLDCLTKIQKESARRMQEKKVIRDNKREYRLKNNLCTRCGEPVKEGYRVCERHYQISFENQKKVKRGKEKTNG